MFPPAAAPPRSSEAEVWIGWSLGGQHLIHWLTTDAPPIRALVLVGFNPVFVAREDWRCGVNRPDFERLKELLIKAPAAALERFATIVAKGSTGARNLHRCLLATLRMQHPLHPEILVEGLEALRTNDLRPTLGALRIPTLAVFGETDGLAPPAAATRIKTLNPGVRCEAIAGAGHAPFLSNPAAFVALLDRYLI